MLHNHELKLFLVSAYLINVITPVFTFLIYYLKLKILKIIFIYRQVNLIFDVTCSKL